MSRSEARYIDPNRDLEMRQQTPLKQSLPSNCVPTAVAMVMSGFGLETTDLVLTDQYFSTARLDTSDINVGVKLDDMVTGLLRILEDNNWQDALQIDLFLPNIWEHTRSSEDKWIVSVSSTSLGRHASNFRHYQPLLYELYKNLESRVKRSQIGVFSGNNRLIGRLKDSFSIKDEQATFFDELNQFLRAGHSIGTHGGMTQHVWAIDGKKSDDHGYWVNDPRGRSYQTDSTHAFMLFGSADGLRGNWFDEIVRVSPKNLALTPEQFDYHRTFQDLKNNLGIARTLLSR